MTLKNKLTLTTCALALASLGLFSNVSAIEFDGTGLDEDGTFHVLMAPPTNQTEQFALNEMISELAPGWGITAGEEWHCNESFTACKLVRGGEGWTEEEYDITYEYDAKADAMVDALIEGITFSEEGYLVHDMEIIQYWAYGADTLPAFSSEIKSLIDHKNIDLVIDVRMGGDSPLLNMQGGMAKVFYNGVLYHIHDEPVMVYAPHIFYVENDAEDLAEALERRIASIFGEEALTMISVEESEFKVSDLIEGEWDDANEYFADYMNSPTHDLCFSDGEWGTCVPILILKDSNKIFTPEGVNSTDLLTNVNITSTAANLPVDAATYAEVIGNDFFNEDEAADLEEKLGTDNYYGVEIGLYSSSLDTEIYDNDGKKFTVSVPVPESLKNVDKLSAYWINYDTGEPEEHYATVSNGVAIFDTDHFSTYILAESSADRPEDEPEDESEEESEDNPGAPNSGTNTGTPNGTTDYLPIIIALAASAIATALIFRKDEE